MKSKISNKRSIDIFIASLTKERGMTQAQVKKILQEIIPVPPLPGEADIIIVVIPSPGRTRRRRVIQKVGTLKKSSRRLRTVVERYTLN